MTCVRVALTLAAAVTVATMNSCTQPPGGHPVAVERVMPGIPADWTGPVPDLLDGTPTAGWLSGDEFGVVTMGSSTCPPIATSFEVVGAAGIEIEFVESPHDPCTADMAATTHVFRMPTDIERPVTVTVLTGISEYELLLP